MSANPIAVTNKLVASYMPDGMTADEVGDAAWKLFETPTFRGFTRGAEWISELDPEQLNKLAPLLYDEIYNLWLTKHDIEIFELAEASRDNDGEQNDRYHSAMQDIKLGESA